MAIVTNRIKKQVISDLLTDFSDSDNNYFAAIGRSEDWNDSDVAPTVVNSQREDRNFRLGLQSVKNIIDASFISFAKAYHLLKSHLITYESNCSTLSALFPARSRLRRQVVQGEHPCAHCSLWTCGFHA